LLEKSVFLRIWASGKPWLFVLKRVGKAGEKKKRSCFSNSKEREFFSWQ